MEKLNYPLHELLRLVHEYIEENGRPPYRNNAWFRERTVYNDNYISNLKAELKILKYLNDDLSLGEKGKQYAKIYFSPFSVRSVEIYIQGIATAGPTDNTIVDLEKLNQPSNETISIPATSPQKETFAVRVSGRSMEALGILSDDYLIIERQDSLWWPLPQDLIVTKYLPHNPNRSYEYSPDPDEFVGPVVKIYLQRSGEKGCHLGWRNSNEQNPYLINADGLMPLGKVIGIYRDYRKFTIPKTTILPSSE